MNSIWNAPCNPADEEHDEAMREMYEDAPDLQEKLYDIIGTAVYELGADAPIRTFETEARAKRYADLRNEDKTDEDAISALEALDREKRCGGCRTWFDGPHSLCERCIALLREQSLWCDVHGSPHWGTCRGKGCRR